MFREGAALCRAFNAQAPALSKKPLGQLCKSWFPPYQLRNVPMENVRHENRS
jgi:hypothetical protein